MKPYFDRNQIFYEEQKDYLNFKRFQIVQSYIYNKLNHVRFLLGLLLLTPLILFRYTTLFDLFFAKPQAKPFYSAFLILVFVIVVEIGVWYYRLKRKFSLLTLTQVIDEMCLVVN